MPETKTEVKSSKPTAAKPTKQPSSNKGVSAQVYSVAGKLSGEVRLPDLLFGAKINLPLLSQAVRVYSTNLKAHWSNTKTRGEVEGSTRKLFKQKGTGRARHGAVRAPIFVGGGIALGPKSRRTVLELPKKMKKMALITALSQKAVDHEVKVLDGSDKISGKTKELSTLLRNLETRSALLVAEKALRSLFQASRNVKNMKTIDPSQLNTWEVMRYQSLVLTKGALEQLEKRLVSVKKEGAA